MLTKKSQMALLASAVTGLGMLAGCGSSSKAANSGKPVTISVFVGKDTAQPQVQDALMTKLIHRFEKQNPKIKVTWSAYDSPSQENTRLETSLATHTGPDVYEFGSTLVPTAYATKAFRVLTAKDWAYLGGRSKFFPAQLTLSGPSPRKDIAVPEYVLPFGLLYNKTMFAAAGISSPPKTWAQFVRDAKKLTNPAKNQWGTVIDPSDPFDPWHIGWVLTRQMGGNFVNAADNHATLNSPTSVKALRFWFDWITKFHIASPGDVTFKSADELHAFENKQVAMLVMQGPTLIPSLNSSPVAKDYAFAPMPTVPYGRTSLPSGGVPVQTFVSGQYYTVPNYLSNVQMQAALKWIKFVTSVRQQQDFFKYYGYMPANVAAYKGDTALNTPEMKSFYQAELHAYPTPFIGAWGTVEIAYGGASSKIADAIGTHTYHPGEIQSALNAANQQVQAQLP